MWRAARARQSHSSSRDWLQNSALRARSDAGVGAAGAASASVAALHHAPSGVLPGVTVRAVLDLARAAGLPVHERFVPVEELADYDEAFMTTSVRSVVPIRSIGEHRFLGADQ